MNNGGTVFGRNGLEALAGEVPLLPAKASSPALFIIHYSLFIIHYSLFRTTMPRNILLKLIPITLVTILLALGSLFWLFSHSPNSSDLQAILWPEPKPLQTFTLVDQHQQPFTLDRLTGKWTFLFFGYTSCPDICPTTMTVLKTVYERLQQEIKEAPSKIQVVFISVDPQRDTPKQLAEYVAFFNQEFMGVTGVEAEINGLTRQLGAGYLKQPGGTAGDYQISHTSTIFLLDPQRRLYAGFSPPQVPETIVSQFLKLFQE